ncbi:TrkA family potassium uptake protein [Candidatus Sumerlaeota bacterium]|nr:TrkA family potassium uptake protein [Candidatus Sumerlaeota bacterium]
MPQIAVVGMNSFGYHLARTLAELGSEVLVVDKDEAVIDEVKTYVAKAVVADISDKRVIQDLNLPEMDSVVLSVGNHFEAAVLAALHLKDLGARHVVAKALSEDHARVLLALGVNRIVFPERDMALRLASTLHGTNIADYVPLTADFSITELIPSKEMVGKTPIELEFRKRYGCQILVVKSLDPKEGTFIPDPTTVITDRHILILLGKNDDLAKLREKTQ